jgi:hypothetical protein
MLLSSLFPKGSETEIVVWVVFTLRASRLGRSMKTFPPANPQIPMLAAVSSTILSLDVYPEPVESEVIVVTPLEWVNSALNPDPEDTTALKRGSHVPPVAGVG